MRLIAVLLFAAAPAAAEVNSAAILAQRPPKILSEFGFFSDPGAEAPSPGVVGYQISSPLFSDHADKDRFIYTPSPAGADAAGLLDFPVGAALIKTFRSGARKIETRVLLRQAAGWKGYAYVWNEAGDAASLALAGADLTLDTEYGAISYHVPNANQCKACHIGPDKAVQPIGTKLRNLHLGDQLAQLVGAGAILPPSEPVMGVPDYRDAAVPLDRRARAYLDANCAHCHSPGLPADTSGLYLNWEETDPLRLGVFKRPVAAGKGSGTLEFDIVPGLPEESILHYRMASSDPGVMMPELGRSVVDPAGLELIAAWIAEMEE